MFVVFFQIFITKNLKRYQTRAPFSGLTARVTGGREALTAVADSVRNPNSPVEWLTSRHGGDKTILTARTVVPTQRHNSVIIHVPARFRTALATTVDRLRLTTRSWRNVGRPHRRTGHPSYIVVIADNFVVRVNIFPIMLPVDRRRGDGGGGEGG